MEEEKNPIPPKKIPSELLYISKRNPNSSLLLIQQRAGIEMAGVVSGGARSIGDAEEELLGKARDFKNNPAADEMSEVLFANFANQLAVDVVNEQGSSGEFSGLRGPEIDRRAYAIFSGLIKAHRKSLVPR